MSFLLDALGKADHDRRRSEVPELRSYKQGEASPLRSIFRGVILIGVLVLSFVAGYALRPTLENVLFKSASAPMANDHMLEAAKPVAAAPEAAVPEAIESSSPQKLARSAYALEVISFSELPTARFAMINGAVVHEGEVLPTGEQLLKIEADAVVLESEGKQLRIGL